MHVGRQMHGESALTHFDGLGIYRLLALIPDGADLRRFVEESLGDLATDDSPENADLRHTLSVLIDTNLNVAETARQLFFHYNTLRYRIAKLERMLGPFTSDPQLRLTLALALQDPPDARHLTGHPARTARRRSRHLPGCRRSAKGSGIRLSTIAEGVAGRGHYRPCITVSEPRHGRRGPPVSPLERARHGAGLGLDAARRRTHARARRGRGAGRAPVLGEDRGPRRPARGRHVRRDLRLPAGHGAQPPARDHDERHRDDRVPADRRGQGAQLPRHLGRRSSAVSPRSGPRAATSSEVTGAILVAGVVLAARRRARSTSSARRCCTRCCRRWSPARSSC